MHRGSGLADPSGGPVARKHCVTCCQATTMNLRYCSRSKLGVGERGWGRRFPWQPAVLKMEERARCGRGEEWKVEKKR